MIEGMGCDEGCCYDWLHIPSVVGTAVDRAFNSHCVSATWWEDFNLLTARGFSNVVARRLGTWLVS